jgi:hypothetical protein
MGVTMPHRKIDINSITDVHWTLYAPEDAMKAAENALLGDYTHHVSELDWEPFDEEDERPGHCDRRYTVRTFGPGAHDDIAILWRLAAHIGAEARVEVEIKSPSFWVRVDTASICNQATVSTANVSAALHDRIRAAINVLHGDAT